MDLARKTKLLHCCKTLLLALGLCGVYALYMNFYALAADGELVQATGEKAAALAALRPAENQDPRSGARKQRAFREQYYALGRAIGEREPARPATGDLLKAITTDYYALLPLAEEIFRRSPGAAGRAAALKSFEMTVGHISRLCLEASRDNIETRNLLLVRTGFAYFSLFILLLLLESGERRFVAEPFLAKLSALGGKIRARATASRERTAAEPDLEEISAGAEALAADLQTARNAWARLEREAADRQARNKVLTKNLELARKKVMALVENLEEAREELQKEKKALKTAGEKLARSNKELEQFAYVASHDLKEPLRIISSFSGLLAKKYSSRLDADADDFIRFITEGAGRATALIDALFNYSKLNYSPREFTVIPGMRVLQKALFNLKLQIEEKKARIICAGLPFIKANESQLIQLFQNILSNALKFNASPEPEVSVGFTETEDACAIYFADNGIGIAPEQHERIFLVCQRLHSQEKYPGSGVGLALCRKIAENHGGRIRVESEPGQGSTFFLELQKPDNTGTGTPETGLLNKAAS